MPSKYVESNYVGGAMSTTGGTTTNDPASRSQTQQKEPTRGETQRKETTRVGTQRNEPTAGGTQQRKEPSRYVGVSEGTQRKETAGGGTQRNTVVGGMDSQRDTGMSAAGGGKSEIRKTSYMSKRNIAEGGMDSQRDTGTTTGTGKAEVRSTDMSDEMQKEALRVTKDAIRRCRVEKDIANNIKIEFDKKYQPHWHCVVGTSFGSKFAHDEGCYIYMCVSDEGKKLHVLLWKIEQLGR